MARRRLTSDATATGLLRPDRVAVWTPKSCLSGFEREDAGFLLSLDRGELTKVAAAVGMRPEHAGHFVELETQLKR